MEMTVTEYREQKKEQAKQLAKHTKGDLVDKLLFAYDTIRRLETKLQNTSSNSEYMEAVNEILHNRLDYLEGVENTNNIVQWIIEDIQCLNQSS